MLPALLAAALAFTLETSGRRERLRLELNASSCVAGCDGPACAPDAGCDIEEPCDAGCSSSCDTGGASTAISRRSCDNSCDCKAAVGG